MQVFGSHDDNWWTGTAWITCGLSWCFYQLFGLSIWRHPFIAEDPLMSKWCNAIFFQTCSDEETNSSASWMIWKESIFSKISFSGDSKTDFTFCHFLARCCKVDIFLSFFQWILKKKMLLNNCVYSPIHTGDRYDAESALWLPETQVWRQVRDSF